MGEKRKARITNNERTSKKEKKTISVVTSSASNDDVEEQSSMHSNSSNSDTNSQQPSITQETNHTEEIEESRTITPTDVESTINKNHIESDVTMNDDHHKITTEPTSSNSISWWSSLVRLFHFGNHTTHETKTEMDNSLNDQSSTCDHGSYLGSVKCRRSLHGDSFVG